MGEGSVKGREREVRREGGSSRRRTRNDRFRAKLSHTSDCAKKKRRKNRFATLAQCATVFCVRRRRVADLEPAEGEQEEKQRRRKKGEPKVETDVQLFPR